MPPLEDHLVLTCEHGGHRIPEPWARLFRGRSALLRSHRGWDPGALPVARGLARALNAPLIEATTSRLLVDLNRSPHNPAVFSETTRRLPAAQRTALLEEIHRPHWQRVREALDAARAPAVHVAVHSFTPVLGGRARRFDLGLLYDPARPPERELALRMQRSAKESDPALRVRRNAPYRGSSDGLTTALRRERGPDEYLGIEIELNQATVASPARCAQWVARLTAWLTTSLA